VYPVQVIVVDSPAFTVPKAGVAIPPTIEQFVIVIWIFGL
jgi:hypothetical protein